MTTPAELRENERSVARAAGQLPSGVLREARGRQAAESLSVKNGETSRAEGGSRMNLDKSKRAFWIVAIAVLVSLAAAVTVFIYLFLAQPSIVPPSETYGSFWLRSFSVLIAALTFALSALAFGYNALEQRQLRYMENYPYLELFPIMSVDPLPLPIPVADLPPELSTFNQDYLAKVAPSQVIAPSDAEFRFLAVALRNVGRGYLTRITIAGSAQVPQTGTPAVPFKIDRRFNMHPDETKAITILPIAGLPEYSVRLTSVEYYGHFVKLHDYDGPSEFRDKYPFQVPSERRVPILLDDFADIPAGQGWVLDFWGTWQPTRYAYVPLPSGDDHFLCLTGNQALFSAVPHFHGQGGAYKDLLGMLSYGQTVQVTARVRSVPGTTALVRLWCHDISPNPKNRYSAELTPPCQWQELSMLYTSTQSPNLRVHLLYTPGDGAIQVDRVTAEILHS